MKTNFIFAALTFLLGVAVGAQVRTSAPIAPVAALLEPSQPVVSAPEPQPCGGVHRVSDHSWELSRAAFSNCLSSLNDVATNARIVPAFKDGVAVGFRLFAIRPGSVYEDLGLKNGDTVMRIGGFALDTPDRALTMYTTLRDAEFVDVELERAGERRQHSYAIR